MSMVVLNTVELERAARRNAPLRRALGDWLQKTTAGDWSNLADVRMTFPNADGVSIKVRGVGQVVVTVFNIKGNEYRLLAIINYEKRLLTIRDVLTHAEYNKDRWKDQL
jgi:mRNA interferase HigB